MICACALGTATMPVSAQPDRPQPAAERKQPEPEQIARRKSDLLAAELQLTDKQNRKVYKIYLQQAKKSSKNLETDRPAFQEGRRPDGPPQGGRRPQGPPPGNADRGGHGPQQSGDAGRPGMQHRPANSMPVMESDKEIAARDKKMRKILSSEQYDKWSRWERQERSHAVHQAWDKAPQDEQSQPDR